MEFCMLTQISSIWRRTSSTPQEYTAKSLFLNGSLSLSLSLSLSIYLFFPPYLSLHTHSLSLSHYLSLSLSPHTHTYTHPHTHIAFYPMRRRRFEHGSCQGSLAGQSTLYTTSCLNSQWITVTFTDRIGSLRRSRAMK